MENFLESRKYKGENVMMLNGVNVTRSYARNAIRERKSEILDKLESGETEDKVQIGGKSYSTREWNKLMNEVDTAIDEIKEEQEEYIEQKDKEEEAKKLTEDAQQKKEDYVQQLYEKMSALNTKTAQAMGTQLRERLDGERTAPYSALADENGIINYNGVEFVCDYEHNALCLGDVSDEKKVLTIPLERGGSLKVNVNNIGDISKAISMFSPADINRILSAISTYEKLQKTEFEIDEMENSVGESEEEKLETEKLETEQA